MPAKRKGSAPLSAAGAPAVADPIEHVVVLMMENRSFDHMLGSLQTVIPDVNGVMGNPPSNKDKDGGDYQPIAIQATRFPHDPMHYHPNVMFQLDGPQGPNRNFVLDYSLEYPDSTRHDREQIMGYYPVDFLPALHGLARAFTICDNWFSSLPGPTIPNRLFMHTGTSANYVNLPPPPLFKYPQDTIFQRLDDCHKTWKIYESDQSTTIMLKGLFFSSNRVAIDDFWDDAAGPPSKFPAYSFIEPQHDYKYLLGDGVNPDLNHPPNNDHSRVSDVMDGERFIARVYNAIRSNGALWNSTLLVVLFDEHGGFYDHVVPPTGVVPPDSSAPPITTDFPHGLQGQFHFRFDRLGVRVPALLISPWVDRTVDHTQYDHASVLQYLTEKWGLGPLTDRVSQATSFAPAIRKSGQPRGDTPPRITAPPLEIPVSDMGQTMVALSASLERKIKDKPEGKKARRLRMGRGPHAQLAVARERIALFRKQQRTKPAAPKPGQRKKR